MTDSPHIVQLNAQNFMQVVVEGSDTTPVLVDFWADWCEPCKALMPVLEKLAIEYNGAFVLAKLDTEANPEIAQQLAIRSLPTVKLFKGRQLVDEFMGALPEHEVRRFLETHVGPPGAPAEPEAEEGGALGPVADAMALFEQGDTEGALTILRAAQAAEPEDADILLALGQVSVAHGDLETAESCINALPEEIRNGPQGKRLAATAALARENAGSASLTELQARLDADDSDSEARYQVAIGLALGGDMQGSLDHLMHLVSSDPGYSDGAPRKKLLELFDVLGTDPLVGRYRRKLFALLH